MSDNPKAPFDYIVAKAGEEYHVFLVRDETPAWWRLIATFRDVDRAEQYAEIEAMMADDDALDRSQGKTPEARSDEGAPPRNLAPPPPSGLGALVRRSTVVEHTRIAHEEVAARAPENVTISHVKPETQTETERYIVSASLLEPQSNCTESSYTTNAPRPSEQESKPVSEPCQSALPDGKPAIVPDADNTGSDTLSAQDADMAAVDGERQDDEGHHSEGAGAEDAAVSDPVDNPAPVAAPAEPSEPVEKINTAAESNEKPAVQRLIPDTDLVDAATLAPVSNGEFKTLSTLISMLMGTDRRVGTHELARKGDIPRGSVTSFLYTLQQKGYVKNVGQAGSPHWLPRVFGAIKVSEGRHPSPNQATPPKAAPLPPTPKPAPAAEISATDGDYDDTITLNDLSVRQKTVLKALCAVPFDSMPKLAMRTGIIMADLPFLLTRLRELGCIGSTTPTEKGRALAAQIASTKVTFPVARVEAAPAPNGKTTNLTHSLTGDPSEGRSALAARDAADKLGIVSYLRKKGHVVDPQASGVNFKIDGAFCDLDRALAMVNRYRAAASLDPLTRDGVAAA